MYITITFHWASAVPTIVTFRLACCGLFASPAAAPGFSFSVDATFTEAPLNLIVLRIFDPFVPIIAPTALLGMNKNAVS